ncbi:unnamed protein product [Zymoseptoria tritici ST99CH_1A5]|uniref:Uncharacterized protein n=1 Tax=Zymoseptoria tritici ST99CH_1A5 TaxID=1276529 RepID=A0A1Y6LJM0_ZYMTR|nr:unnamed protein product [Zymoseptoria tritici ST99CH_1A5]
MHEEASNILYGDNLIEIRLTLYPVTVNGRVCDGELGRRRGPTIIWPAWLQRVQHLRIEVPSINEMPIFAGIQHLEGGSLARSAVPLVAEEGLRNLCEFLAEKHRLRSMRIASATIPLKDIVSTTRTLLYSPRLLAGVRLEYEGDIPERMRNEVAGTETSEVDDLVRNLQANALLNRELTTFQNQSTLRLWHSKLTDIFTVSAENIWEDLQGILERPSVNLYRKGATRASQPISFLLLDVIADLLELYDEWTERLEIVWDELLKLIGTCMVNLSDDHIMTPAPRDIAEDFAELLENYKEEEIDSEDEDVRERIRVAHSMATGWTHGPELSDNLVANVMTSFQKIDIEHRAIAFAGQRYFNLLNSAMGRMIGNAPPRSSREDVTRSPTGIGRRLRSQNLRNLRSSIAHKDYAQQHSATATESTESTPESSITRQAPNPHPLGRRTSAQFTNTPTLLAHCRAPAQCLNIECHSGSAGPKPSELEQAALQAGIVVTSISDPPKEVLLKSDYVAALYAGPPVFRFMELSPELRTRVYEELLILRDSFTCFPQILAASRQIKEEATNILYGDNLIDVRMLADGIYVHGEKCNEDRTDTKIIMTWPHWLRNVQFLRFNLELTFAGPRLTTMFAKAATKFAPAAADIVLHSLCSFLASEHKLRSFQVDISGRHTTSLMSALPSLLHSTHLLGELKELAFGGDLSGLGPGPRQITSVDEGTAAASTALAALSEHATSFVPFTRYDQVSTLLNVEAGSSRFQALERLPDHIKDQFKRKNLTALAKNTRQLARDLKIGAGNIDMLPEPAKEDWARYFAIVDNFNRSYIELEAAEYEDARDTRDLLSLMPPS